MTLTFGENSGALEGCRARLAEVRRRAGPLYSRHILDARNYLYDAKVIASTACSQFEDDVPRVGLPTTVRTRLC